MCDACTEPLGDEWVAIGDELIVCSPCAAILPGLDRRVARGELSVKAAEKEFLRLRWPTPAPPPPVVDIGPDVPGGGAT